MIFIYWIVSGIYNRWGMFLYEYIQSYTLIIYIFITSTIFFICILIARKSSDKNKAIFFTIYLSLFYFFVFIPFNQGAEVEELKKIGFKIVDKIYLYEQEKGNVPETIEELFPNYLSEDNKEMILGNFVYRKSKYELKYKFTFKIRPSFFFLSYLLYIPGEDKFVVQAD